MDSLLNAGLNAVIALSYYVISIFMFFFRKRVDDSLNWLIVLLGLCFAGCGTTHIVEILTILNPHYAFHGWTRLVTAGLSLAMALVVCPMVLKLEAPREHGYVWSAEELSRRKADLLKVLASQRLFLDPNLRLNQLAQALGMREYQLTRLLQFGLRTSFYDLINSHRIEHAKSILTDPGSGDRKILRVAMESGFNSKSVFNEAFKKHTGMTPSAFRRSILKDKLDA